MKEKNLKKIKKKLQNKKELNDYTISISEILNYKNEEVLIAFYLTYESLEVEKNIIEERKISISKYSNEVLKSLIKKDKRFKNFFLDDEIDFFNLKEYGEKEGYMKYQFQICFREDIKEFKTKNEDENVLNNRLKLVYNNKKGKEKEKFFKSSKLLIQFLEKNNY